jgi:hypothetical protein
MESNTLTQSKLRTDNGGVATHREIVYDSMLHHATQSFVERRFYVIQSMMILYVTFKILTR